MLDGGDTGDWLDGGTGADTMLGGTGNDFFIVDNAGDIVTENAGEGTDGVLTSLASYTLGANVENMAFIGTGNFSGTGNTLDNNIYGGSGNDTLVAGDGNDALVGYAGNDSLDGGAGADYLVGGDGDDTITGGGANDVMFGDAGADMLDGGDTGDWLDGGAGADAMLGGTGNDFYIVDNAGDVVTENADGGTDGVLASLAAYTLGANLENMAFTGVGDFTGTGNILDNNIYGGSGNDVLGGGAGNDALVGYGGNDTLNGGDGADYLVAGDGADTVNGGNANDVMFGDAGTDTLDGGDGDDWLDGGTEADTMSGGTGNDFYIVDNAGDTVTEAASGGTDGVLASVLSYTLTANVENLAFTGVGNFTGNGNSLDNSMFGGAGNDTLSGRAGSDTLTGNGGDDTFFFASADGIATDTIVDFDDAGNDVIRIDMAGILTFADIQARMTQVGADVLINTDTTDILLLGTTLASMGADDFLFGPGGGG
jgi:Ca2+-binding RTX toxin-like protein